VKRPVLIVGSIPRIVTVVARSLRRLGIPVDVADLSSQPRLRSSAIREFVRLPREPQGLKPVFYSRLIGTARSRALPVSAEKLEPEDKSSIAALEALRHPNPGSSAASKAVPFQRVASETSSVHEEWPVPGDRAARGSTEFLDAIRSFIELHRHDVLIPADDFALLAIAEHHEELSRLLHVACPPPELVRQVLDKRCTLEAAQQAGVPTPKTFVVANSAQIPELLHKTGTPAILKPAQKQAIDDEFKTLIITAAEQVTKRFPTAREFSHPMLLQEFCTGVGVGVEVLLHRGECVAVFQHRRLKEWPFRGGYAVTAIAEAPGANLVQPALALLRALQWDGVAMVEFRVNRETGRTVLMEVNGRYWGSISLPVTAGVDFPLLQWKVIHGESLDVPSSYDVGTKWRWTAGYIRRLHDLVMASRRSGEVREMLRRDWSDVVEDLSYRDAVFTASDPFPAMFELVRTVGDLARNDLRAVGRFVRRRERQG
jgi:predicted ATP-grasp superfamily ATP-dependent carboligase